MSRLSLALLCSTTLLGSTACSEDDYDDYANEPRPEPTYGTLEVSWSIDGRTDADACDEVGAVAFHMNLYDEGYFIGDIHVPCADFATTQELYSDDYLGRSTLVDENGFAIVRRVVEDFFEIAEGQVTRLPMDFPGTPAVPMEPGSQDAGVPPADSGAEPDEPPPPDAGPPAEADAAAPDAGA